MKSKKPIVCLAATVALLSGSIPVSAQEYTTEGTAECEISCQVTSSYTVTIPAVVSLVYSSDTGTVKGTYQVGVKGDLLLNQMVQVEPIRLTNELGRGLNGDYHYGSLTGENTGKTLAITVNQNQIRWIPQGTVPATQADTCMEISSADYGYAEGTLTSEELEAADCYKGTLVFAFGLEEYQKQE